MSRARNLADLIGGGSSLPSTTNIGNVSSTELGYLDGVTSALQTQMDAKPNQSSGTFTPELLIGGVTTGITYDDQQGVWNKIGNVFHFKLRIALTSKGSSTGAVRITGLPETPTNDYGVSYELANANVIWNNLAVSEDIRIIIPDGGVMYLIKMAGGGPRSWNGFLLDTDITDTFDVRASGWFFI